MIGVLIMLPNVDNKYFVGAKTKIADTWFCSAQCLYFIPVACDPQKVQISVKSNQMMHLCLRIDVKIECLPETCRHIKIQSKLLIILMLINKRVCNFLAFIYLYK